MSFQSPPNRGVICRLSSGYCSTAASSFQSPPNRGVICRDLVALVRKLESISFSPLLIGALFAEPMQRFRNRALARTQSPPNQGVICRAALTSRAVCALPLSVPS